MFAVSMMLKRWQSVNGKYESCHFRTCQKHLITDDIVRIRKYNSITMSIIFFLVLPFFALRFLHMNENLAVNIFLRIEYYYNFHWMDLWLIECIESLSAIFPFDTLANFGSILLVYAYVMWAFVCFGFFSHLRSRLSNWTIKSR